MSDEPSDPRRFEIEFPMWALASSERLQQNKLMGSLYLHQCPKYGRCLLLFTDDGYLDARDDLNRPELVPIELVNIAALVPILSEVKRQGDTHVVIDISIRNNRGRFVPVTHMLAISLDELENTQE